MIQKFRISRDGAKDTLIIEEFAISNRVLKHVDCQDLNEEDFSLINKEEYDGKKLEAALSVDKHAVVASIRTINMFPIGDYAMAIADSIAHLYESESRHTVELIFDDQELLR